MRTSWRVWRLQRAAFAVVVWLLAGVITPVAAARSASAAATGLGSSAPLGLESAPSSVDLGLPRLSSSAQLSPASAAPGIITTFAGGGIGDGGPAVAAAIGGGSLNLVNPYGIAVDRSGNVFFVANKDQWAVPDSSVLGFDRVRRIDAASGVITTVAGTDTAGFSGDGGLATSAQLSNPNDVVLDGAGNLYILDSGNQRVRKVAAGTGIITTVAGGGKGNIPAFGGDGGPATKATLALFRNVSYCSCDFAFTGPGMTVDRAGDIFIADQGNDRVRRVDGRSGIITTVAGGGNPPGGIGDGGPATAAVVKPNDVAVDSAGNLYITDLNNGLVRRVDHRSGKISTFAGGGTPSDGIGDGLRASSASLVAGCVDFDRDGNLVICDFGNGRVRRVDRASKVISTIAGGGSPSDGLGDGGLATAAFIGFDQGAGPPGSGDVAFDPAGNLFLTDPANGDRVRRIDIRTGIITTIAGGLSITGDGGPATSARLNLPNSITSVGGNTYISEACGWTCSKRVRKVDASGTITTFAGGGNPADGFGDGHPALSANVDPGALSSDAAGNVFIADRERVRKVDGHTGIITTVAGGGNPPDGVGDGLPATSARLAFVGRTFVVGGGNAKWPTGTLLIADGVRIRRVDPSSGIITTVAGNGNPAYSGDGGPAVQAGLGASDVVADTMGNILISDRTNSRIRRVDARTGIITTIAGDGAYGLAGIDGPALQAHINKPGSLALDQAGNLFISDTYARVVKIDTAGFLRLVAGTGAPGFGGDGGPAIYAERSTGGSAIALNASGDLFLVDDLRIREVRAGTVTATAGAAGCGQVVTKSTSLTADLGPCPGAAIFVGADNITLNLNGHRVFGAPSAQDGQYSGIMISGRTGVTVIGGQVDHFSAGVAIVNSTNTTVTDMIVRDNVGAYDQYAWADGIVLLYSSHNKIVNNQVVHNGIFENIGVLGRLSDYNLLQANTVTDSVGVDQQEGGVGINIVFNAYADNKLPDRGSSLFGNQIIGNTVLRAYANGISNRANREAQIIGNVSDGAGLGDPISGVGIGIQTLDAADAHLQDLVQGNSAHGNAHCGIAARGLESRIIANTATGNGIGGLVGVNNCTDLAGVGDPPCKNSWIANTYGTSDGSCSAPGKHQVDSLVGPASRGDRALNLAPDLPSPSAGAHSRPRPAMRPQGRGSAGL